MAVETVTAKKATKATGNHEKVNIAQGLEKAGGKKGEVTGHQSIGAYYICAWCLADNWVDRGYSFFVCWKCEHLNYIP